MPDKFAGLKQECSGVVLMLLVYTSFSMLALPNFCSFFRVLGLCEQDSNYVLPNKISHASSKAFLYYLIFVIVFDFSCMDVLCLSVA